MSPGIRLQLPVAIDSYTLYVWVCVHVITRVVLHYTYMKMGHKDIIQLHMKVR